MRVGGGSTASNKKACLVGRINGGRCLVNRLVFDMCTVFSSLKSSNSGSFCCCVYGGNGGG